jgi:hypothetical protein
MIEFIKFIGGVAVSASILASAFAFILKSVAHFGGTKPSTISSAPQTVDELRRPRSVRPSRRVVEKLSAAKSAARRSTTAAIF